MAKNKQSSLNKILMVFCVLVIPVSYACYVLHIKPWIGGIITAVVCFFASKYIVKKFFS